MNAHPHDVSLPKRSLRALGWNYAGTAIRSLAQLAIGVVLARLLTPEQFGTVAIGWIVIGLGMLVAEMGLGVAIVQRPTLTDDDVGFAVMLQLSLGAALCIVGLLGAPQIALWFGHDEATPVIRAMALLFLVQSAGATPLALMRRELDFRSTQIIGISSYLVGYVAIGIPGALLGWGAWALVAAQLTQACTVTLIALRRSPKAVMPRFRRNSAGLIPLGAKVTGTNFVNYGLANADSVAVGRLLGAEVLGVYGRALALVQAPSSALITGIQGVLFSTCSRAQSDRGLLGKAYIASSGALASIVLPVFVTAACVPSTIIEGLYGQRWSAAAPVLTPLAISAVFACLAGLPGPVLSAMNRVEVELRTQTIALLVLVPASVLAGSISIVHVAWAVAAVRALQFIALSHAVMSYVGTSVADVLGVLVWPSIATLSTAGIVVVGDRLLASTPAPARLAADFLVAGAALALCVRVYGRRWIIGSRFGGALPMARLPHFMRRWLMPACAPSNEADVTLTSPSFPAEKGGP